MKIAAPCKHGAAKVQGGTHPKVRKKRRCERGGTRNRFINSNRRLLRSFQVESQIKFCLEFSDAFGGDRRHFVLRHLATEYLAHRLKREEMRVNQRQQARFHHLAERIAA
jgi:hypothetical protein